MAQRWRVCQCKRHSSISGGEDPLEEGTAAHSSALTWRIPWTEEPGGLQSRGSQRVRHNLGTKQQHQPSQKEEKTRSVLFLQVSKKLRREFSLLNGIAKTPDYPGGRPCEERVEKREGIKRLLQGRALFQVYWQHLISLIIALLTAIHFACTGSFGNNLYSSLPWNQRSIWESRRFSLCDFDSGTQSGVCQPWGGVTRADSSQANTLSTSSDFLPSKPHISQIMGPRRD